MAKEMSQSICGVQPHTCLTTMCLQILPFQQQQAGGGCIALVYSVVLTRTPEKIRDDMDEKDRRFMGAHSYCTQELVNLLTTGVATSNVFDGDRDLGGGIILHGVHVRFFM